MKDARETIAQTVASTRAVDYDTVFPCDYDTTDAILAALPEIVGAMVKPLVWGQIDEVTYGAVSALGNSYTVWVIDGYGYCKFPNTPAGERFQGGLEAAKQAANDHHRAQVLGALGL